VNEVNNRSAIEFVRVEDAGGGLFKASDE